MLDYLRVENFAVVEKVELDFSDGLNVLTGETGAGKSILIGAINLFLKKKVPENAIRGQEPDKRLIVEAMFSIDDDELVLRREITRKKSQAYINGDRVPFMQLKEKAEELFNIYGQNEHVFLLNPANHRLFLDDFCHNETLLLNLADVHAQLKLAMSHLEKLKQSGDSANEKLDFLNFRIGEIEDLKMEPGDDEKLSQQIKILSSAEEILSNSNTLVREFYQTDRSIYNTIATNVEKLDYLLNIYPELKELKDEVHRFYNLLPELSSSLSNIAGKVEYNEDELNRCSEKMQKLNRLRNKYHMDLNQLLETLETLKKDKEALLNMDFSIKDAEKKVAHIFESYVEGNAQLRQNRQKHVGNLSEIIRQELTRLEMPQARFNVQIDEVEPTLANCSERGTDKVEFYFSTNPGQQLGRIKDIASGGELSRLMLVLKSIQNKALHATYIFDEIDTGIGGKTAEFVGEKLKRIAHGNQVICISHLPQIASFAASHFHITKEFKAGETFSNVKELSHADRVDEIARMMVGSAVNGDVLKAAGNLLDKNKS